MSEGKVQTSIDSAEHAPFVTFYREHSISPVRQDISNLQKHFSRRDHLYRNLGIPPFAFTDKSVIEFGPGSGHNALFVTSQSPARYMLVDANPTGLNDAKALINTYFSDSKIHEFTFSYIQEYTSSEKFDVVLCEGVIPHQNDPGAFSRHVGGFVRSGGVLVITTADYIGVLAEVLRRLVKTVVVKPDDTFETKLSILCKIFERDFASLQGASRPIEDWVADTLINPWHNKLYSIGDAIEALGKEFEVYGSSPKFFTDWRWYKEIYENQADINQRALKQYDEQGITFLDYRFDIPPVNQKIGAHIRSLCESIYWIMIDTEVNGKQRYQEVSDICAELAGVVKPLSGPSAEALSEASAYFKTPGKLDPVAHFSALVPFFGRAQQYLSFIRPRA